MFLMIYEMDFMFKYSLVFYKLSTALRDSSCGWLPCQC